jgi:phosphate transport system substrate-binding protein
MEDYPNVQVNFQKGGSGAGIASVRAGAIDIGSASKPVDADSDFPAEQVFQVGTDAVVVIIDKDSTVGLTDLDSATLNAIYSGSVTTWTSVLEDPDVAGTYCTGGTIDVYHRSDKSGTEECFTTKMIKKGGACYGDDKQLDNLVSTATGKPSNQEVLDAVAGNTEAIGFCSYGIAAENSDKVTMIAWLGITPSDSSVEKGIEGNDETAGGYVAIRPLNYIIEEGAPAIAFTYIEYCLQPENNINFNEAADYFAMY